MDDDQLKHVSLHAHIVGRGLAVAGDPVLVTGHATLKYQIRGLEPGIHLLDFRANTASGRVVCEVRPQLAKFTGVVVMASAFCYLRSRSSQDVGIRWSCSVCDMLISVDVSFGITPGQVWYYITLD